MNPYITTPDSAPKLLDWLANRGGVAVWRNCNLSSQSLGTEVFTPAKQLDGTDNPSPDWQYDRTPVEIVTDPAAFTVQTWREVSRVKVIRSKYGPPCDPIAKGRKSLDKAIAKAGAGATWRWDFDFYQYASPWRQVIVEVPASEIPLVDWKA